MSDYQFTSAAEEDLRDIWNWIGADDPKAADKMLRNIREGCQQIVAHPDSGSRRPAWTDKPVRFLLVRRIIFVIYIPTGKPVIILRVLHAARDIKALLREKTE